MTAAAKLEPSNVIVSTALFEVRIVEPGVYLLAPKKRLTEDVITEAMDAIWAYPGWQQPWGLLIDMHGGVRYDPDIRSYRMPPPERRAVGTVIVSTSAVHRMVVSAIGVGLKLTSDFVLSAHDSPEEGAASLRALIQRALDDGRPF